MVKQNTCHATLFFDYGVRLCRRSCRALCCAGVAKSRSTGLWMGFPHFADGFFQPSNFLKIARFTGI
jgi:hypothetical protein